jgi:hypothetical protein
VSRGSPLFESAHAVPLPPGLPYSFFFFPHCPHLYPHRCIGTPSRSQTLVSPFLNLRAPCLLLMNARRDAAASFVRLFFFSFCFFSFADLPLTPPSCPSDTLSRPSSHLASPLPPPSHVASLLHVVSPLTHVTRCIVASPRFATGTLVRFFFSSPLSFADRFFLSHSSPPARAFVTCRPLSLHVAFRLMTSSLAQRVAARVPPQWVVLFVSILA